MLIKKRIPEKNVARFYRVGLQADLITGWSVVREWGRIGRAGRVRCDQYSALPTAEIEAHKLTECKIRRGYRHA